MAKKRKTAKTRGISLFEILIIIAILASLTTLSFLSVPAQLARARDAKRKSDLLKIRTALITYHTVKDSFPQNLPECNHPFSLGSSQLLSSFPCDPKTKAPYFYQKATDWFKLYTSLENTQDPIIETIGCDYGCGPEPECQYNYGTSSTNTFIDRCIPPEIIYACSPGGGAEGHCDQYDDPEKSECPLIFINDPTCEDQCSDPANRCKNASGKHIPE